VRVEDWLHALAVSRLRLASDYLHFGRLGRYIWLSRRIPGWTRGDEAVELARCAWSLGGEAVIVEIGAFLGCSTVLLAGARKLRGSGSVHTIDPFDATGDSFSTPIYRAIYDRLDTGGAQAFEANVNRAGVGNYVTVHQSTANEAASAWASPVDMLFLDGDHSREGARSTYESWIPFLLPGGMLAVHNSKPRSYGKDHDGSRLLVREHIHPPEYSEIRCVGSTTFARRTGAAQRRAAVP